MALKKILVTGADGFIGSHLTELLVRSGYDVKAMVKYNSFGSNGWLDSCAPDVAGQFKIVAGDIRDPYFVMNEMRNADVVLHLAALIAIPYSYQAPDTYVSTNVSGTLNVLQAAKVLETQRVVCTSTSETYGSAQFVPISEDHPLNAQSPYAATKIAADQLALSFNKSFGLPVSILRPFNTYGPRQSARAVIPTIISQIASGKEEIRLGSLHPTRDFTYVEDTAFGFMQEMMCAGNIGRTTNIGSAFEISIEETVNSIARVMNSRVTVIQDDDRLRPEKSEVDRLFACTRRAQSSFDWKPKHGGYEGFLRGLKKTADWFSQPHNLLNYKTDLYNV